MSSVSIHEAKTHLSRLIQRALDGEEIVITKRNEPVIRLEVIREKPVVRRAGGLKGLGWHIGDNFDDFLEDFADYAPPLSKVAEDSPPYKA